MGWTMTAEKPEMILILTPTSTTQRRDYRYAVNNHAEHEDRDTAFGAGETFSDRLDRPSGPAAGD